MAQLSDIEQSKVFSSAVLGSTEGSFYRDSKGNLVDDRYKAIVSVGKSGLSFGIFQNDAATNDLAAGTFRRLLDNAVKNGSITQKQADNWYYRASADITAKARNFTAKELDDISNLVLKPGADAIDRLDRISLSRAVSNTSDFLNEVQLAWSDKGISAGVFDPSHPDYAVAVGHILSWANRTGKPTTIAKFMSGKTANFRARLRMGCA